MEQVSLSDISVEEGGSSDDEDETPGVDTGSGPGLPAKLPHNQETEEADDEDDGPAWGTDGPSAPGGPWRCPACGELSDICYRCSECGKDLAGETSKGSTQTGT